MTAKQVGQERPYEFEFFPAPADLQSTYLTTLSAFRTEAQDLRDMLPVVFGQLCIFMRGSGTLHYRDGTMAKSARGFFIAPLSHAAEYRLAGPLHAVNVGLTQLGWAALTGLAADAYGNRTIPGEHILGAEFGRMADDISRTYNAGKIDAAEIAAQLVEFIRPRFGQVSDKHRYLIETVRDWRAASFNPNLEVLYGSLPYSTRQTQRLVSQFFGVPPATLVRANRALRAAAMLSYARLTPEMEADLGEAFFDQPHMIREISAFAGRSPSRLGAPRKSVLTDTLHPDGFFAGEDLSYIWKTVRT